MASTITNYSNLINVNYPTPGEDNDSQGFRNNFGNIQAALNRAAEEISVIQLNAVNLSDTNDFGYNISRRPTLQAEAKRVYDNGTVGSTADIDYSQGTYQIVGISGATTLNIINWPESSGEDVCGKIRIKIVPDTTSATSIEFSGATVISNGSSVTSYTQTTPIFWDVWSDDSGSTVYAQYVGKASA